MARKIGKIDTAHFQGGANLQRGGKASVDSPTLGDAIAGVSWTPVPGNVETAVQSIAANSTPEDADVVSELDKVLSKNLPSGERLLLYGTIEVINGEVATNNFTYIHGDTPDGDDTVRSFDTAAAVGSEFINGVTLFTDEAGNIRVSTDDIVNVTWVFHLEGYAVVRTDAGA